MACLYTYIKSLSDKGLLSGEYRQPQSVQYPPIPGTQYRIRIFSSTISSLIPNAFVWNGIDTLHFRLTGDGGITWTVINLIEGFYTVADLNLAITDALVGIGLLSSLTINDPPIYLGLNPVDGLCYIVLDTTKAVPGTVQIGISFDLYDTWQLVGFSAIKTFVADGIVSSDVIPFIDFQGSNIGIITSFTGAGFVNGTRSSLLAAFPIPFINKGEIRYPSYDTSLLSPYVFCDVPRSFTGFKINFINLRTGTDIMFLGGDVKLQIEISSITKK
jgi:hypothetical protein